VHEKESDLDLYFYKDILELNLLELNLLIGPRIKSAKIKNNFSRFFQKGVNCCNKFPKICLNR
jgi:hypothetical protein